MPPMPPPSYPEHSGMYAAWEQEDLKGIVGVTLDNSSLLISIESNLRGKILVEETDAQTNRKVKVWKEVGRPKMNDRGVQAVMMDVRTFLDKNVIMGYYSSLEELKSIWLGWAEEFGIFLAWNSEEFEIVESYRSQIATLVCTSVLMTMLRALNGNEKQGVYKMVKRIENPHITDKNNQQSMFGTLPRV